MTPSHTDRPLEHLNSLARQYAMTDTLRGYEAEIRAGNLSRAKAEALFRADVEEQQEPAR